MPNRPTYPRIALPPALALRVDALRAAAPTGRPSRQAVVERALALGLDALEGGPDADEATVPVVRREVVYGAGETGPGSHSLKTILFGHAPTPMDRALGLLADLAAHVADLAWVRLGDGEPRRYQCQGCDAERLEWEPGRHVDGCEVARLLARVVAHDASDAPTPAPAPADAPTGQPWPALARQTPPLWQPPPGDPRWGVDDVGAPYAREFHVVAVEHEGRRVEVAVAAGDTVAVVRRALAAAWQARDGLATGGKA